MDDQVSIDSIARTDSIYIYVNPCNFQGNINSVEAKIICDSLVKIILDRATSK